MIIWLAFKNIFHKPLHAVLNIIIFATGIGIITILSLVQRQFEDKFEQLKKEYQKLIDEYKWNDLVYKSKFSFEPVIGKIYHLYYGTDGKIFLSLISPSEWNREHIGSFKYNHDNKWIKID